MADVKTDEEKLRLLLELARALFPELEFVDTHREAQSRAMLRDATPAAVAALDRAMEENVKLRALFDRFGQYLDHAYQCGLRNGASGWCTCGLVDFVKQVAELGAST